MKDFNVANTNFVNTSVGTFAIQMGNFGDYITDFFGSQSRNWEAGPINVAGIRVVPWGSDNNLPTFIRDLLEKNNLGPGVLDRKTGLLYGQGPRLYRPVIRNGELLQEWIEDKEIQEWLDSWDYRQFIRSAFVEYNHFKGVFVKVVSGRAVRIGKPWISRLECLPSCDCRMVWPASDRLNLSEVTHFLVGDFNNMTTPVYHRFPVFDASKPNAHEAAVAYHNLRSAGRNMYSVPSFFGSIPWMQNANSLPEIISCLNNNMIAASYLVKVPDEYWSRKEEALRNQNPSLSETKLYRLMEQHKDELARQIADVMAGKNNAGKFFMSTSLTIPGTDKAHAWEIEPIEMNIDKYIDALTKISRIADSSTTSGFGLNPALANIIIDGKGDSGSQMLYALKLFYGADCQIAEDVCLQAANDAIRINFPGKKGIYLGMYRKVINKEDNVTASQRATNQV